MIDNQYTVLVAAGALAATTLLGASLTFIRLRRRLNHYMDGAIVGDITQIYRRNIEAVGKVAANLAFAWEIVIFLFAFAWFCIVTWLRSTFSIGPRTTKEETRAMLTGMVGWFDIR